MKMVKKIVLYSSRESVYCSMIKNFLMNHNLKFKEKRVDKNNQAMDELLALVPGDGVPILVVDNKVYRHLSEDDLRKIFEIKK